MEALDAVAACAASDGFGRRAPTVLGRTELTILAHAVAEIGEPASTSARQLAGLLRPRRGQVVAWAGWMFWGAVDGVLGMMGRTYGEPTAAIELLESALALHERAGWRALSAMSRVDHAASPLMRSDDGDRERASHIISDVKPVAQTLGLRPLVHRLHAMAPPGRS